MWGLIVYLNKRPLVSVVIPTWNNEKVFSDCLRSLLSFTDSNIEVHVVVNGEPYDIQVNGDIKVNFYNVGKNLGWMGGINYCKDKVNGDFVLLLNDDTQVLDYDNDWLNRMLECFELYRYNQTNPGAVVPISNAIMGLQNINESINMSSRVHTLPAISGCCALLPKRVLDEVGWLDETLRGGDDVDLSIRLMDAKYSMLCRRDVFIIHRYAVTGKRVSGDYWDSKDHVEDMRIDLIRKHGLKKVLGVA